jgi:tyrosinase
MTAVRRNVATNPDARKAYVEGVTLLKQEATGLTTADLGIAGFRGTPPQPLGTYDLFVLWHQWAMDIETPPGSTRNAAHRGPVFGPWHRLLLLFLEVSIQRVLDDADVGLPYWDWAADGELAVADQPSAAVWADDAMGGDGGAGGFVTDGPFSAAAGFRLRLWSDVNGRLWAVDRPLRRRFGAATGFGLPTKADTTRLMALDDYDAAPWDASEATAFRNQLEGWRPADRAPATHNRVHVWIGGDMSPGTSPNDPAFFLNHVNVDRLWAAWAAEHPEAPYVPGTGEPDDLFRHRIDDPLYSIFGDGGTPWTVRDVLDPDGHYTYDSLEP